MDGWMDRKKIDEWLEGRKNRWIVGWMEGYTIIYIFLNRWMVGRKDNNMKNIDGWLDGQKKNI